MNKFLSRIRQSVVLKESVRILTIVFLGVSIATVASYASNLSTNLSVDGTGYFGGGVGIGTTPGSVGLQSVASGFGQTAVSAYNTYSTGGTGLYTTSNGYLSKAINAYNSRAEFEDDSWAGYFGGASGVFVRPALVLGQVSAPTCTSAKNGMLIYTGQDLWLCAYSGSGSIYYWYSLNKTQLR